MNKQYQKIEFTWGGNIETAVNKLLSFKEKGILACGEFNGVTLYSDTVTMDGAYNSIIGQTKSEFDESQRKWREDHERREKEFKESIPTLSEEWMIKGKEVLSEDKWELWDRIVPVRLNDLYRGMELGCCLDIVKILNNDGSLDEAKKAIEDQNHSGMSFGLVCSMVREFSDRGNEFVSYVR
jgi:hypothetical protein